MSTSAPDTEIAIHRVGGTRAGETQVQRMGFFTDTTVCIGCKACEVACKQWNQIPADGFEFTGNSYDNTGDLSASSWRHVKFIEQFADIQQPASSANGQGESAARLQPIPMQPNMNV